MTITQMRPGTQAPQGRVVPASGAAYWLSAALALVSAVGGAVTFFVPGVLTGPAAMNGSARGTAFVLLFVAVPLMAGAMWAAARGSVRAVLAWLGAVGYVLYNSVMFLFATPFNRLFPVYVAMLSLALWTVIALLSVLDRTTMRSRFLPSLPARGIAVYVWVIVALNALAWLGRIVPALFTATPTDLLDGTGLTTNPVYVQDLAFWLPLMAVAAIWLWRRQTWGFVAVGSVLALWVLESIGVAVDQWFGQAADPASTVASATMVWAFALLALVGTVPLVLFYRNVSEA
jgi:hypothetical protein